MPNKLICNRLIRLSAQGFAAYSVFCSVFLPYDARALTASQAVNYWRNNPDMARAECNILRRWNKDLQASVFGDFFLDKMAPQYQMSRIDTLGAVNWLVANICPDVW